MQITHYNSLNEVLEFIDNTPRNKSSGTASTKESEGFSQTKSLWDAMQLAKSGWEEGASKIRSSIRLAQRAKSGKRTPVIKWDIAGGFVDIGKYMSGEPECMGSVRTRVSPKGKSIECWRLSISTSFGVDSSKMVELAKSVAVAISRVESRGKRVKLTISIPVKSHNDILCRTDIVIKNAGDAISPSSLAYGCGHPSLLRRLVFATYERGTPEQVLMSQDGYGTPCDDTKNQSEYLGGFCKWKSHSDIDNAIKIIDAM
jgi:hypothetical protein